MGVTHFQAGYLVDYLIDYLIDKAAYQPGALR